MREWTFCHTLYPCAERAVKTRRDSNSSGRFPVSRFGTLAIYTCMCKRCMDMLTEACMFSACMRESWQQTWTRLCIRLPVLIHRKTSMHGPHTCMHTYVPVCMHVHWPVYMKRAFWYHRRARRVWCVRVLVRVRERACERWKHACACLCISRLLYLVLGSFCSTSAHNSAHLPHTLVPLFLRSESESGPKPDCERTQRSTASTRNLPHTWRLYSAANQRLFFSLYLQSDSYPWSRIKDSHHASKPLRLNRDPPRLSQQLFLGYAVLPVTWWGCK